MSVQEPTSCPHGRDFSVNCPECNRFATDVRDRVIASLREELREALRLLKPLGEAADGYEDHASDDTGACGPLLSDARAARAFLQKHNEMPERDNG